MMKSWISFLLPNDEYKEKRVLYFFAEGALILFISQIIMLICTKFFNISAELALLVSVAIFLFYVTARYIISGIEYTDITTERSYKREIKNICIKTCGFVVIYIVLYLIIVDIPSNLIGWMEIIGLLVSIGIVWFFTNYISLNRSYKKNKELI
ncbi:uncharacterized protein YacL [Metabacillus crassostreae]|uniref:DUF3278 domain-containing protein n=1 Tax=Metabacillus crassostreae TaxID=929098 RepID=UPI001957675F|nr:DUF3278 domain-containing protein [Metabacillus crassostreae]MBM7602431.1 uncharacterized protein YacL [Metabacillus crassostreae]